MNGWLAGWLEGVVINGSIDRLLEVISHTHCIYLTNHAQGMANYNKNLFVGIGGSEAINLSHFIGAVRPAHLLSQL